MTDKQREKLLKFGAIAIVGLFLLDRIVITPALASWSEQSDRIHALQQKVDRGHQLIERQDFIRSHWAQMMHANLPTEVSAAEKEAFQSISRWATDSGVTFPSLSPQWDKDHDGYQTYEFRATANGTQAQLARFIYDLETDPIPVNLEEYEIATKDEHGAQLTMTARFTFLRINLPGASTE